MDFWSKHYKSSLESNWDITSPHACFEALALNWAEFRNLFDYRVRVSGQFTKNTKFLKERNRVNDLHFNLRKLGGGAFVQHGSSTWIFAKSIGKNLFISQNVTIGLGKGGTPTIGDNVSIRTGAVVVGAIKIGSNVMIGANAVVNFDVPDGARVYAPRSIVVLPDEA
ncbi:LbetaH domain-containing protein [Pseudomonas sp. Marseille-QA0332]